MISVKVPKEIKDYQAKPLFNLTFRQIKYAIATLVLAVPTYMILTYVFQVDQSVTSWILMVEGLPLALGIMPKAKGMPMEEYLYLLLRNIFSDNRVVYKTTIKKEDPHEKQKKSNTNKHEQYQRNICRVSKRQNSIIIRETRKKIKETQKFCKTQAKINKQSNRLQSNDG